VLKAHEKLYMLCLITKNRQTCVYDYIYVLYEWLIVNILCNVLTFRHVAGFNILPVLDAQNTGLRI